MCIWSSSLQLDCNGGEQDNLYSCARSIPERTGDSVAISNTRTLQKCSCPSPWGDNCRGYQARLHRSSSSTEHLRSLDLLIVAFEDPCDKHLIRRLVCGSRLYERVLYHSQSEQGAQPKDDAISPSRAQRRSDSHLCKALVKVKCCLLCFAAVYQGKTVSKIGREVRLI